ncbi:MAG: sigma 54-interacting transcriptional regulator [Gracilibacteraceae bacterium]|jgi:transcriptional regulator with PAS, ATPase and Fis domain|nr:sigma 54-interacting transcriptional regulator [Gracilibacteraceae bacterium]
MNQPVRTKEEWARLHSQPERWNVLGETVRAAWERSAGYNIDFMNALPQKLPAANYEQIKRQTKRLFVYANSVLEPLARSDLLENVGIILFANNGSLLRLYGGERFLTWAAASRIEARTKWAEDQIGANVFSVGMRQGACLQMSGFEHYAAFLTGAAFVFAPMRLDNGDIMCSIVLAAPVKYASELSPALAVSIVRGIELQLFWFTQVDNTADATEGVGSISLDQSIGGNRILSLSEEVKKMLSLPRRDYFYETLDDVIERRPENKQFWDIINNRVRVNEKAVQLSQGGKNVFFYMSTAPYNEEGFHIKGISVSMNSLKHVAKLTARVHGDAASYSFDDVVHECEAMADVIRSAKMAAATDSSILLMGESGVGKDVLAQAIHRGSRRAARPFVAINCASFSKDLIASELFGYEPGAFTGARKEGSIGKFELANTGTLFLDEIGDMPLDLQALLLRILEERSFRRVGGNNLIATDVRVVTATNKKLWESIETGMFREDLFYRLGVARIQIPPLRSRNSDIILLINHALTRICARLDKPAVSMGEDAIAFCKRYTWPGNVRELFNLLEGIISTSASAVISEAEIRRYLGAGDFAAAAPPRSFPPEREDDEPALYDERRDFAQMLKLCRNNKTKAARNLGVPLRTFYRKLKRYGMM